MVTKPMRFPAWACGLIALCLEVVHRTVFRDELVELLLVMELQFPLPNALATSPQNLTTASTSLD